MSSLITLSRHFHQVRGKRGRVSLDGIPNHSCEQETEKQEETQWGQEAGREPKLRSGGGTWEVAEGLGKDESGRLCRGAEQVSVTGLLWVQGTIQRLFPLKRVTGQIRHTPQGVRKHFTGYKVSLMCSLL